MPQKKKKNILGQQELLPLEFFTKAMDPLSVVTAGQDSLGGGESMLQALPRRIKEFFAIPEPLPFTAESPTDINLQTPGGTQYGVATEPRDIILPSAGAKATDLVSALSVPKQAVRARLPEQPITATPLPETPGAVTPENILDKAKGGKFSSFVSNPNFIRFLAEMGSAIGGEGSVGQQLGQATIELQRSQIYDQALTKALAGEPFDDLPVNLLSVEERQSLNQERLLKLETEAKIEELKSKAAERDIPVSEQYERRLEEIKVRGGFTLGAAKIGAISRVAAQGKTSFEIGNLIKKESESSFGRSAAAFGEGLTEVRPEFNVIDQAKFIQNIGLFGAGGAKEQVSRFFLRYNTSMAEGDMFYTEKGIFVVNPKGSEFPANPVLAF